MSGPREDPSAPAAAPDSPRPAARPPEQSAAAAGLPQVRGHNEALDGVRAIAALMVLVFHVAVESGAALAPGVVGALLATGEMGVPLFFALSGLLLYRPWVRAALDQTALPPVGPYLWRRALRIMPPYWIVALAALLLWSRDDLDSVWAWVGVMTLTFVFDTDPWWLGTGPYGLGQMWSLSVEACFYALLPVIGLLAARAAGRAGADPDARARRLMVCLVGMTAVAVLALVPQYYPEPRPYMYSWLPRCLSMFAVGMALAVLGEWAWRESGRDGPVRRLCRTLPRNAALCWVLAGICYLVAATPAAGPRFVGSTGLWISLVSMAVAMGFAFFAVAPVALRPERPGGPPPFRAGRGAWLEAFLAHRVMRYLGRVSYGIFLWQFVVLYLWREFTGEDIFTGSFWMDLVPVAAGTVLMADLTHRFVERPVRRWYGSVGSRRLSRPTARRRTPVN
ncbi:acyltransferase family protein [Streptomonospora wellingtoniae]|uniref:Acyltransferase n=1 Tax=Streptomonospora wellingtoniae TaxID=3075544 RepID=A0ABU2KQT9_9ACTN|nr:acyltransferase [Streptomonospora sp. DSM 45055]MDT0301651.1 acyltransferase [Streptomonospora sp. DSM 45055]